MYKRIFSILAFGLAAVIVVSAFASAPAQAGNGAPSGKHFNLNIIGNKGNGSGGPSGATIHVPLFGKCKIILTLGSFGVTDNSCNDGDAAGFSLPRPTDNAADLTFNYSVWVRALTPKGSALMTTCFTDDGGAGITGNTGTFCNNGTLVLNLSKANSAGKFQDVSRELLQVCVSVGGNLTLHPLFQDNFDEYFWEYLNSGLRLAQFRIYPDVPSTAPVGGTCTRSGGL